METFEAPDGTLLALHRTGSGDPLICVPGGPMQAAEYLGDLGGLAARRELLLLDLRGTGRSAVPADHSTFRCDRQVGDIEALRLHLGLDRIDLAAHSGGATLALLYAARHPGRIRRLLLINPSPRVTGLTVTDENRREVAETRRGEQWFPEAFAALERIWAGEATGADWGKVTPFMYGRWDAAMQAAATWQESLRNDDAAGLYYGEGAFDPAAIRSALAGLPEPVLLVTGERDIQLPPRQAAEFAGLFRQAEVAMQPDGGHFAWLDDPSWFVRTATTFLR